MRHQCEAFNKQSVAQFQLLSIADRLPLGHRLLEVQTDPEGNPNMIRYTESGTQGSTTLRGTFAIYCFLVGLFGGPIIMMVPKK